VRADEVDFHVAVKVRTLAWHLVGGLAKRLHKTHVLPKVARITA
jgi:hypothetical protein